MSEMYKDKLEILQQRIPIGDRQGLALLEKTEGNADEAEKYFTEGRTSIIVNKTGIPSEIALHHLQGNNFDIKQTIKIIENKYFTATELILKKDHDKEEVLDKVFSAIVKKYDWKRTFLNDHDEIKDIPHELYSFVTVMEWLYFENWEDYESALFYHLDMVTEQMRNKLNLPELADALEKARSIAHYFYEKYETSKDHNNYTKATNELRNNKEFIATEEKFILLKPLLEERLYEFVKNNIEKFP
ncbi:hypothetical protein [Chryseobacterium mucoviscidosis]|uniref:Uncharacterized protein n=1 Tax=Chryseobacterium mucoviscidosis TaxID=1945581 RepID=A0A202C4A6_9FLAO|nr:hypothetical protein [Chryseobacterium mucoviscidosis]OVE58571.1 hypothetical protein B0E34_07790 [Chryseobacterium mucoviscidosis]